MAILANAVPALPQTAKAGARTSGIRNVPGARKIVLKELAPFTRQMGAMLNAGMPLVQVLMALEDQTNDKGFKQVIAGLRASIEGGSMFSEALTRYPTVFNELYIGLIRAGESGGILTETAEQIATFLEANAKLRRKVKSAMMYPIIIMIMAIILATSMIVFIVPVFAGIYKDFGGELPGPTRFLMAVSDLLRTNGVLVIIVVSVAIAAFHRYKKSPAGAYAWDRFCLKFPVTGMLTRKIAVGRFASTFAQLIRSGVPILRALESVAAATGNLVLGKILLDSRAVVERGEPLSNALRASKEFPAVLVHMLSAGERTGKMDEMMKRIADFYEDEVSTQLSGLTSMIEPLLMVFLGVIIGGIVLCMFLPIFKMHELVNF